MRRGLASVVLAVAVLGAIAFVAPSGGATSGETCTHVSGVALFVPPLPKVPSHATVPLVIMTKGMTVYTCTGSGGAVGTVAFTVRAHTKTNCQFLSVGGATSVGAGTIKWATGKRSTFLVTLKLPRLSELKAELTGSVTAGQFKGLPVSATLALQTDTSMCAAQPLSRAALRFATGTAFVIGTPPPTTTTTTTYTLPTTTTMATTTTTMMATTTVPGTTTTTDTTTTTTGP